MNKFAWGNFDKIPMYVDKSYGPSVQSQRILMMRTANELIREGKNDKAIALCEKYFEAFPHFNFAYDPQIVPFISAMVRAGGYEQAKKHIDILSEELLDRLIFYNSLTVDDLQSGFSGEYTSVNRSKDDMIEIAKTVGDQELIDRLNNMFAPFISEPVKN